MVKRVLLWVLPCIPTTLPTMLFCRISELTILLEENNPIEHHVWEKMVAERVTLMNISNDIKIIGELSSPTREHHSSLVLSFRDINRVFWTACNSECAPQPFWVAHQE